MPAAAHRRLRMSRTRLLKILLDTSFHSGETEAYPLSSGVSSEYYVDCKMVLSYAEARELAAELILERLGDTSIDAVGGMALGAYPIATAVSDAIYRKTKQSVRAFVIRKEAKKYGLKKFLEGDVGGCHTALIVDDVVTTGNSTIEAIRRCQEEGLEVVKAIVLVDRQEVEGKEKIERLGVPFEALFTLQDLLQPGKHSHAATA
jgi:orotate phosphoribosyltransferase